jgi:3-oxoacyl-[acyl-carrier protein] reductase
VPIKKEGVLDLGLKGKVALVAASSEGLGRACARSLAAEGAIVAVNGRRADVLEQTRKQLAEETGSRVLAFQGDLSKRQDVERVVKSVLDELGRIDILVTNCGPPPHGRFMELDDDKWDIAHELVMKSVVRLCRLVIPVMQRQQSGRIINITSTSVKQPLGEMVLSSASRMGIVGLSKILANQYASAGITVHTVCPGPYMTGAEARFFAEEGKKKGIAPEQAAAEWLTDIPLGRIGDPQEFGDVVAFLASARASYMTGNAIQVDGGRVQSML